MTAARDLIARQILARHSKSFALAGRLLPAWCRQDATALYAWCRRCDDAVDIPTEAGARRAAVEQLRRELDDVYGEAEPDDPVLAGFKHVVRAQAIPRRYAEDLIAGMAMDVEAVRTRTFDDLLLYCYRVAGTVGLMMAHIMRVRDPAALRRATDLGIAMQLTNICRDVAEDALRGRVYLPADLADKAGAPSAVVAELLRRADQFYESGDAGLTRLPLRCAIAIRAARLIYAEIGAVIARRGYDVTAGRAIVSRRRKLWLVARAAIGMPPRFIAAKLWPRGGARRPRPVALPFTLPIGSPSVEGTP